MSDEKKGMLQNCEIYGGEESGWMFHQRADGTVVANLDGYAILPIEELRKLERAQITPELRRRVIEMAEIDDDAWADCDHEVRPSVTTLISDLRDAFAATGESDE